MTPPVEAKPINKYLVEPVQKRLGYYKVGRFMYDYGRKSKKVPNPPIESHCYLHMSYYCQYYNSKLNRMKFEIIFTHWD